MHVFGRWETQRGLTAAQHSVHTDRLLPATRPFVFHLQLDQNKLYLLTVLIDLQSVCANSHTLKSTYKTLASSQNLPVFGGTMK